MDENSLFFALNRCLSIFTRYLSVRLIHGLAVLVLAGGSASAWAHGEPDDPVAEFCDLVIEGGRGGSSCAPLAEDEGGHALVSYEPAESPWRLGAGPTADSGSALFSADVGSGGSSCLRLRLNEDQLLLAAKFEYTVAAGTSTSTSTGTSTGTLTIVLHRDGEGADDEEILRTSGVVPWTSRTYTVDPSQLRVVGISICYEKGSGQDRAGVDNIRLETVSSLADCL